RRRRRPAQSFGECLRHFLNPQAFRQAQQARTHDGSRRWSTHALVLVLLAMTWCTGDSQAERFETARAFYVATHPKTKRRGATAQGLQQALAGLPLPCLRALAAAPRRRVAADLGGGLMTAGFVPLGCDGSLLECPRGAELERRLPRRGKGASAPMV